MAQFLLEAKNITFARGGNTILSGISLGIHRHEFGVLLGPSGSGKSSLMRCMAGIVPPDRGEVLMEGRDLRSLDAAALARSVGMVPQDDIIHTSLKLRPALEYAARLRLPAGSGEDQVQAAVDRVLKAIELDHRADVRIKKLSGGQRKRASMGIELLQAPQVLFLDEPTSGLDPDLEATTMKLLRKLADEGRAVLTTTHSTASVDMADFLVVVVQGYLAWAGPPKLALKHFGVVDPDLIFKALRGEKPATWAKRYSQNPIARNLSARPKLVPFGALLVSDDKELEDLLAEARKGMPGTPQQKPAEPAAGGPAAAAAAAAAASEATVAAASREQPAGGGGGDGLLQLRLAGILTSRYIDLKLSDFWGSAILVLQAPLIGLCISVAFDGESYSTKGLQFVLAMVAVWLGTFSACREVVKERLIFLRERRAGVPVRAYLISKVVVLAFLAAIQSLLLVLTVMRTVSFDDASVILVFGTLFLTCLCANALGLMLSSVVKSQNSLIALVPVALIPQLIFSEVLLGDPGEVVEKIELAMIASWSYDMLHELPKSDPEWLDVLGGGAMLFCMQIGMLLLSAFFLRAQE